MKQAVTNLIKINSKRSMTGSGSPAAQRNQGPRKSSRLGRYCRPGWWRQEGLPLEWLPLKVLSLKVLPLGWVSLERLPSQRLSWWCKSIYNNSFFALKKFLHRILPHIQALSIFGQSRVPLVLYWSMKQTITNLTKKKFKRSMPGLGSP